MGGNAKQIGRYIVNWFINIEKPTSNLALQKLLYFTWIDYYNITKIRLFDDSFVAWPLGPVVLSSYYDFCAFAADPIFRESKKVDTGKVDLSLINNSLETRKDWTVRQLVTASHKRNGAWAQIYGRGEGRNRIIPYYLIIEKECNHGST